MRAHPRRILGPGQMRVAEVTGKGQAVLRGEICLFKMRLGVADGWGGVAWTRGVLGRRR